MRVFQSIANAFQSLRGHGETTRKASVSAQSNEAIWGAIREKFSLSGSRNDVGPSGREPGAKQLNQRELRFMESNGLAMKNGELEAVGSVSPVYPARLVMAEFYGKPDHQALMTDAFDAHVRHQDDQSAAMRVHYPGCPDRPSLLDRAGYREEFVKDVEFTLLNELASTGPELATMDERRFAEILRTSIDSVIEDRSFDQVYERGGIVAKLSAEMSPPSPEVKDAIPPTALQPWPQGVERLIEEVVLSTPAAFALDVTPAPARMHAIEGPAGPAPQQGVFVEMPPVAKRATLFEVAEPQQPVAAARHFTVASQISNPRQAIHTAPAPVLHNATFVPAEKD